MKLVVFHTYLRVDKTLLLLCFPLPSPTRRRRLDFISFFCYKCHYSLTPVFKRYEKQQKSVFGFCSSKKQKLLEIRADSTII